MSRLLHHLPGALIVAALVAIGHHYFHLLAAVDGYAFMTLGNLSAIAAYDETRKKQAQVAVVLIDGESHEKYYGGRSPLDRCKLKSDLEPLYLRRPRLMVVDLDLSPALHGLPLECQEDLIELIASHAHATKTVLMDPCPASGCAEGAQAETAKWRKKVLEEHRSVAFGDARLRAPFGLLTHIGCEDDRLARAAFKQVSLDPSPDRKNPCEHGVEEFRISPFHYLSGLHVVSTSASATLPGTIAAVFFGAGYGHDDVFLTPLGNLYGVEVHAAAYMSLVAPPSTARRLLDFCFEVMLGLLFGGTIMFCWRNYYAMRLSPDALYRQAAPLFVFLLGAFFLVCVALATFLSGVLLHVRDLWLSPIPIAIGMLIESFFVGTVHAAVDEGHRQRQAILGDIRAEHEISVATFRNTLGELLQQRRTSAAHGVHEADRHRRAMLALTRRASRRSEKRFLSALVELERQRPRHAHSLSERWRRFCFGDFWRLLHAQRPEARWKRYLAAGLLMSRRVIFFALVIFGAYVSVMTIH